jgi:hypothetical protein
MSYRYGRGCIKKEDEVMLYPHPPSFLLLYIFPPTSSKRRYFSKKLSQANISRDLKQNLKVLRNILGTSSDVIIREFSFG